jgi:hypothetical protein
LNQFLSGDETVILIEQDDLAERFPVGEALVALGKMPPRFSLGNWLSDINIGGCHEATVDVRAWSEGFHTSRSEKT